LSEAAAALVPGAARLRLVARLPLSRLPARHRGASDRHCLFNFVEFRPNERIPVATNPEYWKPDRPYLDGIEWRIVPSLAMRILSGSGLID
jgi:hypothetical protein